LTPTAGRRHALRLATTKEAGVEEKEVIEKRTIRREEPANKVTNVNVGPDGTTNVQTSGDEVVEEEHVVEEREHKHP
jgi:hypothetical protein